MLMRTLLLVFLLSTTLRTSANAITLSGDTPSAAAAADAVDAAADNAVVADAVLTDAAHAASASSSPSLSSYPNRDRSSSIGSGGGKGLGILLAISSSVLIGTSFIFTKKGLIDATRRSGQGKRLFLRLCWVNNPLVFYCFSRG